MLSTNLFKSAFDRTFLDCLNCAASNLRTINGLVGGGIPRSLENISVPTFPSAMLYTYLWFDRAAFSGSHEIRVHVVPVPILSAIEKGINIDAFRHWHDSIARGIIFLGHTGIWCPL